jgi:hypothetical protein
MLDAFAGLLVELHLANCFWGDCSLSNVLYRFDAEAIVTIMVDAETAQILPGGLTDGRRLEDIEIMIENVAGGMSDIAAEVGVDIEQADLDLGYDIAERYTKLWAELRKAETITTEERFRITERIDRLNRLGFDVEEVDLVPSIDDTAELMIKVKVGGRNFHANRLKSLTGVEALENQAKAILSDVHYYSAKTGGDTSSGKATWAVKWRVSEFEPLLARLRAINGVVDPVQAYTDLLHHRYMMASTLGRDVPNDEAFADWVAQGRPGYPLG